MVGGWAHCDACFLFHLTAVSMQSFYFANGLAVLYKTANDIHKGKKIPCLLIVNTCTQSVNIFADLSVCYLVSLC